MEQSLEAHEDGRGNVPAILTGGENHWSYIIDISHLSIWESFGAYRKLAVWGLPALS
jgi:hypothetical protein